MFYCCKQPETCNNLATLTRTQARKCHFLSIHRDTAITSPFFQLLRSTVFLCFWASAFRTAHKQISTSKNVNLSKWNKHGLHAEPSTSNFKLLVYFWDRIHMLRLTHLYFLCFSAFGGKFKLFHKRTHSNKNVYPPQSPSCFAEGKKKCQCCLFGDDVDLDHLIGQNRSPEVAFADFQEMHRDYIF